MKLPNSSTMNDVGDIRGTAVGDEWAPDTLFPKLVTPKKPSNTELEKGLSSDEFQCQLEKAMKIAAKKQEQKLQARRDEMDEARFEVNKEKQKLALASLSKTTFVAKLATKRESITFAIETIRDLLESKKEIAIKLVGVCDLLDGDANPRDEAQIRVSI